LTSLTKAMWIFVIVVAICSIIRNYVCFVFDAEKPKQKKIKAKASLSEMMKKVFENMTRQLKPSFLPI